MWASTTQKEDRVVTSGILNWASWMSPEAQYGYNAAGATSMIDAAMYNRISDGDFRKLMYKAPAGHKLEAKVPYIDAEFAADLPEYTAIKFRPAQGECNDFNVGNAIDYCMMRIEEMYFIEMEAKYHLNPTEGVQLLKDFMTKYRDSSYNRIQSGADFATFKKELLLQKRIEFWGEGILLFDYKRLDEPIDRSASNHAGVFRLRTQRRSPQWNIVITRAEFQSNTAINDSNNNPDPSEKIEIL